MTMSPGKLKRISHDKYFCDGPKHEGDSQLFMGVPYTLQGGYGSPHDYDPDDKQSNGFHFCCLQCLKDWSEDKLKTYPNKEYPFRDKL